MNKELNSKIISIKTKEVDHSVVVGLPNKSISLEESIEQLKKSFQHEDDKTIMNDMIQKLNDESK